MDYAIEDLRLFCLMRTDLASMNPGKAIAQGMHAQAHATLVMRGEEVSEKWRQMYREWEGHTSQGFGSTISLGATYADIQKVTERCKAVGVPCGIIHDPTYPLLDGPTLHLIPLDTCAWFFAPAPIAKLLAFELDLHP